MKKLLLVILFSGSFLFAQDKKDTSPIFFGYVRAWHQTDFSTNQGEFLAKMARLGVRGNVNEFASYRVLVDFVRLGKLSTSSTTINGTKVLTGASASFSDVLLDAEAIINPMKNLSFSLGQFKVPFSTDNLRSGADIDFVNRPLLTSVAPGLRDFGFMGTYSIKGEVPVEFKAGLFNGAGQNKSENDKTTNYSLRTAVQPIKGLGLSANYYGGKASGADLSIFDFGAEYKFGGLFLVGEYGQRTSTTPAKEIKANSYFIYTVYDFDFGDNMISHLMPALRYENYDPNSDTANNEISRFTAGLSLQFAKIKFAQFRVNYELFDYKDGSANPNKLIFEIQTRF
jgi:hypothetical protein